MSEYLNGLRISRADLHCKQPHTARSKSTTFNIPNRASTVIKLILRCKPQNTGVSSSKAIQTSKQMQMYKSTRMQAKQMKGAVCSCTHTNCYRTIRARARTCVCVRARACVRLKTVNVCLCPRRRACVRVSNERAPVFAPGKTHTHTHTHTHKITSNKKE